MLYPFVKFKSNCCNPSKFIDPEPKIDNLTKILGALLGQNFADYPLFKLGLYLMVLDPSVKFYMELMHPSRVIEQKQKV